MTATIDPALLVVDISDLRMIKCELDKACIRVARMDQTLRTTFRSSMKVEVGVHDRKMFLATVLRHTLFSLISVVW
jgi:hypothetical protein